MPDLSLTSPPPRPELLRQLRLRLPEALPGLRLVAEGILGAGSTIDFVGVDAEGRATLVLVGEDDLQRPRPIRSVSYHVDFNTNVPLPATFGQGGAVTKSMAPAPNYYLLIEPK